MILPQLMGVVLACAVGSPESNADAMKVPLGQRQLFLDDDGICRMQGLERTMHVPEKRGAVVRPDQPWELWLQTHCMPAWDEQEQVFKLWLLNCTPNPREGGSSYAESKDGIHWTKPILRQKSYQGSSDNNLLGDPVAFNPTVVCDPNDPDPSRRYKGLFFLMDQSMQAGTSPDGIHWTRLNVPKLPSGDESNFSYDCTNRTFLATLKLDGPHGRSHAIWTSTDFNAWTNTQVVFSADDLDQKLGREHIERCFADPARKHPEYNIPEKYNVDVYNLGVFRYEGFYIGMPAMFHQTGKVGKDWPGFDAMPLTEETRKTVRTHGDWSGFHHVQLASSRDLHHWTRLGNRQPFLDLSPTTGDAYDTQVILPPSDALVRGDELWFYYTGMKSYAMVSGNLPDQGAVCLAVLRRDGFLSLDAGATPGVLWTRPFVCRGSRLFVNVDASGGTCEMEVLDGNEKPLAVSNVVTGDQPRAEVSWKSGGLSSLLGQTVSLRFTLRNARLYSFWLEDGN